MHSAPALKKKILERFSRSERHESYFTVDAGEVFEYFIAVIAVKIFVEKADGVVSHFLLFFVGKHF